MLYPSALRLPWLWLYQEHTHKDLWLPGGMLFSQGRWEGRSRVTSHKQVDGCNALVTAVDISAAVGACIPVSGRGNTECAGGVVTECAVLALPCNFRLS